MSVRQNLIKPKYLYGNSNIIKRTLETFSWVKQNLEVSFDKAGPAIHATIRAYKEWFGFAKVKGNKNKMCNSGNQILYII